MATATIVSVWRELGQVKMAIRVSENGRDTEYIGSVPDDAAFATLSPADKKDALRLACKAARDAQQTVVAAPVVGISGSVTV